MSDDPNRAVVLMTVLTEAQGAMIVAALEAHGVRVQMTGALTSGFRAWSPGEIQLMVRSGDLESARSVLQAIEQDPGSE